LQHLLGIGLVFPEIRRGSARLEAGQFLLGFGGFKDSSADRQRVLSDRRSGVGDRQQSALVSFRLKLRIENQESKILNPCS
jgi:hypothetical protein